MVGSLVVGVVPTRGGVWSWLADTPHLVWYGGTQRVHGFVFGLFDRHFELRAIEQRMQIVALERECQSARHRLWLRDETRRRGWFLRGEDF